MTDLKKALKEAKLFLGSGKSQEAIDLLQDFLDNEQKDYMLFSFAALANANLEEFDEAQELYEQAISLDSSKSVAWLGLFKLYEAGHIDCDHRGLEVCQKIMSIGDQEKKSAASAVRRRILLQLGQLEELRQDVGDDPSFMAAVIDRITAKKILSTTEFQLVTTAFESLRPQFRTYPEHHLKFCKYKYETDGDAREAVTEFIGINGATDSWVIDRLVQFISEDFFVGLSVESHELWLFLSDASICSESTHALLLLTELRKGVLTGALEYLDQLSSPQKQSYPTSLISSRLFADCENWEIVISVLCSSAIPKCVPDIVTNIKNWFLARANLAIYGKERKIDVFEICRVAESVPHEFIYERVILGEKDDDSWLKSLSISDLKRALLLRSFVCGNHEEAAAQGLELIQSPDVEFEDLLWTAEAFSAASKDCVSLLVKAAKMNPRSSRVFFLLGQQLSSKNPVKARGCLERAVKVRPSNEEYVKALDEILATTNEKEEVRLNFLKELAKKANPLWLREAIAKLSLATNDVDSAITELQKLVRIQSDKIEAWAKLAEAYAKKGHLNASLNAYEQILTISPDSDYAVPFAGVFIRLHKFEEVLEKIGQWRDVGTRHTTSVTCMDILEAQAHLSLTSTLYGEEKLEHIRRAIAILTPIITNKLRYSLLYKLAGDALLLIAHMREDLLSSFQIDSSWDVKSTEDAVRQSATFYSVALELSKANVLAWKDLVVAFLVLAARTKERKYAKTAAELLKKAISMTTFEEIKSSLWVLLGEARRLQHDTPFAQQHCFVRALQLNKANDEAWLRLAILYLQNGKDEEAHKAFETALKYNPQSAEAWCGWALKAEKSGHLEEGIPMYRQAMAIKSLPLAVEKYTAFECETVRKTKVAFDTSCVLREFPEIFDVLYSFYADTRLFSHLGVLAETFGHYADAVQCHELCQADPSSSSDFQRALVKNRGVVERLHSSLTSFAKIAGESTETLLVEIKKNPIYSAIFAFLQEDDEEASGLRQMFTQFRKKISIPLVVATIIHFQIPISDASVRVLHDVLPRHELIDVFPTVLPDGLDTELQYLEHDGEAPFRYRHYVAKDLFEELKKRREELPVKQDAEVP